MDVDCVIGLATYGSMQEFESLLRKHRFVNDTESGVICRWKYDGEIVDIMPDRENIIGFTNRWYQPGFQRRVACELPDGTTINILPPLYYLATKIEAIRSRGGNDLRLSHDFEDIIYVINNRSDILSLFDKESDDILAGYISSWASETLRRPNGREEIECMLPYGDYNRVDYIIEILKHFSR